MDEFSPKDDSLDRLKVLDSYDAVSRVNTMAREIQTLKDDKFKMQAEMNEAEMKHKAETDSLKEGFRKSRKEVDEYRNMSVQLGGKPITMDDFKKAAHEEVKKALRQAIDTEVDSTLRNEERWPKWFTDQVTDKISQGINKGLDAQYRADLQAAINDTKQREWPKFLEDYNRRKILPFLQTSIRDQFRLMTMNVSKACDKRGTLNTWRLKPDNLVYLLEGRQHELDCVNPECKDWLGRHQIKLNLGDVVLSIVGPPTESGSLLGA